MLPTTFPTLTSEKRDWWLSSDYSIVDCFQYKFPLRLKRVFYQLNSVLWASEIGIFILVSQHTGYKTYSSSMPCLYVLEVLLINNWTRALCEELVMSSIGIVC